MAAIDRPWKTKLFEFVRKSEKLFGFLNIVKQSIKTDFTNTHLPTQTTQLTPEAFFFTLSVKHYGG